MTQDEKHKQLVEAEDLLFQTFNEEIAQELILEKHGSVDEELLKVCLEKAKGSGWDAASIYDLITLAGGLKTE